MATGTAPEAVTDWQTVPDAAEPNDWQTVAAPPPAQAKQPSGVARFISSAAAPVKGALKGFDPRPTEEERAKGLTSPYDYALRPLERITEAQIGEGKKALDPSVSSPERIGHGLAAVTPLVGPWAANVGETLGKQAGAGDYAGAAGTVAGNAALALAPKAAGKVLSKAPAVARAVSGTGPKVVGDLVKETQAENDASSAKAGEAKAVETKRTGMQKDIHEKSRELQARIETARNNAPKEGNEKYDTVHEELNALPADMEKVHGAYLDAANSIGEVQAQPPIVIRLGKTLEQGEQLTYKDEQALYSELGRELSKGTLPGGTYHAYDLLHEQLGEDMQRLADARGLGPQLNAARTYWKQMKQTFGKPYVPRDAASKTLRSLSPEFAKEESSGNSVRLLGRYDEEIPRAAGEVTEARKGLKSLPKAKPTEAVKKTIGIEDIRNAKAGNIAGAANYVRERGRRAAVYGLVGAPAEIIIGALRGSPTLEAIGLAQAPAALLTSEGIARFLENPRLVEALTKVTPADIAKIPPELRGNLSSIAQAAQAKGIKVSPALIAATIGAAQPPKKGVAKALTP